VRDGYAGLPAPDLRALGAKATPTAVATLGAMLSRCGIDRTALRPLTVPTRVGSP